MPTKKIRKEYKEASLKEVRYAIIENFFLVFFFIIFSISSPVPIGTVDLVTIIFVLFEAELRQQRHIACPNCFV